ncbi:hypothetical protein ABT001_20790 [Streptomyces sp. NPDC002793]|uniref:hypothetical protein n=1 Tax=Streptomyces sp. NPDC002793 TaxID=3154432 RepID=UPI0033244991
MGYRYYLYGSDKMSPQEVRDALSTSLGLSFDARQSDFKGGTYHLADVRDSGKITVEENWEDEEGYLAEPAFPTYFTLVYVTEPATHVLSALENAGLLQRLKMSCVD